MNDLLLSDNPDVMNALLAALCDPGRFTPRAPRETLESWQRRAVVEHAAPYIQAAERARTEAAEAKLAAIAEHCRGHLRLPGSCCPHLAQEILAIAGEEEDRGL